MIRNFSRKTNFYNNDLRDSKVKNKQLNPPLKSYQVNKRFDNVPSAIKKKHLTCWTGLNYLH